MNTRNNDDYYYSIYTRYEYGGEKLTDLAIEVGKHYTTLIHLFKRRGWKVSPTYLSVYPEDFFSNDEYLKYWSGFIAADGNLYKAYTTYTISLYLQGGDLHHLKKLEGILKSEYKVSLTKNRGEARFRFKNEEISDYLISNGITPRKTKTMEVSDSLAKSPHFWRGVVDGDGCVYINKKKPHLGTIYVSSSSLGLLNQFKTFCESLEVRTNNGERRRSVDSMIGRKTLIESLYVGSTEECRLDRKYELAKTMLGNINHRLSVTRGGLSH